MTLHECMFEVGDLGEGFDLGETFDPERMMREKARLGGHVSIVVVVNTRCPTASTALR